MVEIFKYQFLQCNDTVHERPEWRESLPDAISKSTSLFKCFSRSPLNCQSLQKTWFTIKGINSGRINLTVVMTCSEIKH